MSVGRKSIVLVSWIASLVVMIYFTGTYVYEARGPAELIAWAALGWIVAMPGVYGVTTCRQP